MRASPERRARGAYETPPPVVRFLCRQALARLLEAEAEVPAAWTEGALEDGAPPAPSPPPLPVARARSALDRLLATTVLDPAAGQGAFLVGMLEEMTRLAAALAPPSLASETREIERAIAEGCLHGVEIRPGALAECERRIERRAGPGLDLALRRADSLSAGFDWAGEFPGAFARRAGFDIVIGNPPYVNMVEMDALPSLYDRDEIRARFETARGGFDLFVPFTELALGLVAPGGFLSFLVPNKILSAEYADRLRRHLAQRASLLAVCDLSGCAPFRAGAYPVALLMRKGGGALDGDVAIYRGKGKGEALRIERAGASRAPVGDPFPHDIWAPIAGGSAAAAAVDALARTAETIGDVCVVRGAATVAEAYRIGERLREGTPRSRLGRLLVTGTIERFGCLWGKRRARVLGRSWLRPVLDSAAEILPPKRLAQARSRKVIVSGLALRPTAFLDAEGGWVAGKSTVILYDSRVDLAFLCGLLNSALYRAIYAALFGGLALSGGYLRVGPPEIRKLPLLAPSRSFVSRIAALVHEIHEEKAARRPSADRVGELDARIDARVSEAAKLAHGWHHRLPFPG